MLHRVTEWTRHEIPRIKHSRFLATAAPASSDDEALSLVRAVESEFSDARHHCYAFRLGVRGERYRFHDAGEPSSSAGRPILQQIETKGLTETCVVVTRWFGGVKLGMGGLVRAYGGAAAAVLDRAPRELLRTRVAVQLRHAYGLHDLVQQLVERADDASATAEFGEDVTLRVELPEEELEVFLGRYRDLTAGRGVVERE